MARLEERPYTYFSTVRGMCRSCRQVVPARVSFRGGAVWQESLCPDCGGEPAMIASDQQWYLDNVLRASPDRSPLRRAHPPKQGCPHDCGPCTWHASSCQLPVVSVTNACNLDCPICFTYNRPDHLYHMPVEEMRRTVDWVVESSGPVDLINVTGGEPTLHPQILDILECCRRPEIGRVTMNSNGLRLAEDRELCARLAELGVCVILSLSALDAATSLKLHGRDVVAAKLRAIENLTAAGARMGLLNVMVRGVNEDVAGRLLEMLRQNDLVLSLTVQTMTYTGQGGGSFPDRRHMPVDEAARLVAAGSRGALWPGDFVSRPAAHPLCYAVAYLLRTSEGLVPFTRFVPRERISALLADSYLIRLGQPDAFFRSAIDELYARGEAGGLRALRELVEKLYPQGRALGEFERQRLAESAVRTVTVHAHMDEDTFDCSRACLCPDLVPAEPGRLIPACTYNLFYRMKDERFYVQPD
ncbi:MAG TPA: radical SAM protein [Planctomycetota bacterium]|nr:radical SAM protein [Planctomycetota bacterium]